MSQRPRGTTLAEFLPLGTAERKLLTAVAAGEIAQFETALPILSDETNTIRAEYIRFLAVGGDENTPIHEKGICISGGCIIGLLDLQCTSINFGILLLNCRIFEEIILNDSTVVGLLNFQGSSIAGLKADRIRCSAGLFLRNGFLSRGEVRLLGAHIVGDFNCRHGFFIEGPTGISINADGIDVSGSIYFDDGFVAAGAVRLLSAKIGGSVSCRRGVFNNQLAMDGINVRRNVDIDQEFVAAGEVRLLGAHIQGDLSCRLGFFKSAGIALNCQSMRVNGILFLDEIRVPNGIIFLGQAAVRTFSDDNNSATTQRIIDGFTYSTLESPRSSDADACIRWLETQIVVDNPQINLATTFRPQPWLCLTQLRHFALHAREKVAEFREFLNGQTKCGAKHVRLAGIG
ncbi:hypothetical protein [Acidiphilium acidophilum]|uniref:Uncharacterized protein n=1 Tax=Acidiphilium acidophilum TaxID=76588 RepID=A0AAW9DNI8_ACIAO|nr:hypothetical protein [Acidiphilium acidophilum]MDX5930241.1 hypothetical protein [Acidiphilium acidophilum]